MLELSRLPDDERAKVREQAESLYQKRGGVDIDRAIARDRKVLELHERELEHVATLPFDQHYRWRIAPSVALRAQKDLERQQARREELFAECAREVLQGMEPEVEAEEAVTAREVQQFTVQFAEAMDEVRKWQEGKEAPPPVPSAAA